MFLPGESEAKMKKKGGGGKSFGTCKGTRLLSGDLDVPAADDVQKSGKVGRKKGE